MDEALHGKVCAARVHAGHVSEFHENSRKLIKYDERNIAVLLHKRCFYAIDNACYHHGGPLLWGDIEDLGGHPCIVCPWHSYRIALDTGEGLYVGLDFNSLKGEARETVRSKGCKQRLHKVTVDNEGEVYVLVDLSGPALESDRYATLPLANQEEAMSEALCMSTRQGRGVPFLHSGKVLQAMSRGSEGFNPLAKRNLL